MPIAKLNKKSDSNEGHAFGEKHIRIQIKCTFLVSVLNNLNTSYGYLKEIKKRASLKPEQPWWAH